MYQYPSVPVVPGPPPQSEAVILADELGVDVGNLCGMAATRDFEIDGCSGLGNQLGCCRALNLFCSSRCAGSLSETDYCIIKKAGVLRKPEDPIPPAPEEPPTIEELEAEFWFTPFNRTSYEVEQGISLTEEEWIEFEEAYNREAVENIPFFAGGQSVCDRLVELATCTEGPDAKGQACKLQITFDSFCKLDDKETEGCPAVKRLNDFLPPCTERCEPDDAGCLSDCYLVDTPDFCRWSEGRDEFELATVRCKNLGYLK